jgi:hypothetical protein
MNIFLSWSGERSRQMSEFMRDWLGAIFPRANVFMSEHIEKGSRGAHAIAAALERCDAGIFLLTSNAASAPWVNFEAGAISKAVGFDRVFCLMLDNESPEVSEPVVAFSHFLPREDEIRALVKKLNDIAGEEALNDLELSGALATRIPQFLMLWEGIGGIEFCSGALQSRHEKLETMLEESVAIFKHLRTLLSQVQSVIDFANSLGSGIEKLEMPPRRMGLPGVILKPTRPPDGSCVHMPQWPEGRTFTSWETFDIARSGNIDQLRAAIRAAGLGT